MKCLTILNVQIVSFLKPVRKVVKDLFGNVISSISMIVTLPIIFLLLLTTNCTPYRYLEKHKAEICATCPSTIDSIYIEKIRLDTVWFYMPGDTTILWFKIPKNDSLVNASTNNSHQNVNVSIIKGKGKVISICKADSLMGVIKSLNKEITIHKDNTLTYVKTLAERDTQIIIKDKTLHRRFWIIFGLITLIVLYVGWRVYNVFKPRVP